MIIINNLFWVGTAIVILAMLGGFGLANNYASKRAKLICIMHFIGLCMMGFGISDIARSYGFQNSWWETGGQALFFILGFGAFLESQKMLPMAPKNIQNMAERVATEAGQMIIDSEPKYPALETRMEFSQAVKTCLKKKYLTISGRASRSEFWWFQAFIWGSIILVILAAVSLTAFTVDYLELFLSAVAIFYIILIPPVITATARRFHDIDMSGWWVLGFSILNSIPYLGIISGLVMLYFLAKKGTSGDNRFGWDPVGNTQSADMVSTVIPADTSNHAYLIKNEAVLSGDGPKAAPANLNSSSIQHEPSLTQTAEPADEEMYEIALNELDNDKQVSAIYAKALALSQGDTDKARWKYVDLRVGHMKAEEVKKMDLKSQAANRLAERQRLDKRNSNLFDTVLIGVFLILMVWAVSSDNF